MCTYDETIDPHVAFLVSQLLIQGLEIRKVTQESGYFNATLIIGQSLLWICSAHSQSISSV